MTNNNPLLLILFLFIFLKQINSQNDSPSISTTENTSPATLTSMLLETENNGTTVMLQNTTFSDVGQNFTTSNNVLNTTRGPILTDENNNTSSTTFFPNKTTNNTTTILLLTTFTISTNLPNKTTTTNNYVSTETQQSLKNINKIISNNSTEHVLKKERSILADGSEDISSQSIEEQKDENEKIKNNNLFNNKIPSSLLIYNVQRNSNYVEQDFGKVNSIKSSTDKINIEASKEDKSNEEEKGSLEKGPKLRQKRDNNYLSEAMNRLNNPLANAQQELKEATNNANNNNALVQPPQIIQIPPNSPNIIFTSDTSNVTLQKGPGFISIQTSMGQNKK